MVTLNVGVGTSRRRATASTSRSVVGTKRIRTIGRQFSAVKETGAVDRGRRTVNDPSVRARNRAREQDDAKSLYDLFHGVTAPNVFQVPGAPLLVHVHPTNPPADGVEVKMRSPRFQFPLAGMVFE